MGCIVLKVLASRKEITISPFFYPLFTVKPTMTFVLFIVLALYIKTRELRFRRHGKTHEEYKSFLNTNKNSGAQERCDMRGKCFRLCENGRETVYGEAYRIEDGV